MTHLEYRSQMLKWFFGSYAAYVGCFLALPLLAVSISPSCSGSDCAAGSVMAAGIVILAVWLIFFHGAGRSVAAVFARSITLGGPMPLILTVLCLIWFVTSFGVLAGLPFMLAGVQDPKYFDFPVLMLFAAAFLIFLAMPGIEQPSLRFRVGGIPFTARHAKIAAVAVAAHATLINSGSVLQGFGLTSAKTAWMVWASSTPAMSLITWVDLALFCLALIFLVLAGDGWDANRGAAQTVPARSPSGSGFGRRKTP